VEREKKEEKKKKRFLVYRSFYILAKALSQTKITSLFPLEPLNILTVPCPFQTLDKTQAVTAYPCP